jgi:hypothetical protein
MAFIKISSKPKVGPSIAMYMIPSKFSIFILLQYFCLIKFCIEKALSQDT